MNRSSCEYQYIFKKENVNPKLMDSLVYWMVGATIVGARLGHVFFYDWGYYKNHIGEILMVWKGGLASHGAAISIVLAMYWWSTRIAIRPSGATTTNKSIISSNMSDQACNGSRTTSGKAHWQPAGRHCPGKNGIAYKLSLLKAPA